MTILSGLQHVGLVSIFLLVPVLACREAGLAPEKIVDVLALSMLVMAVGPVLRRFRRGGVGSGVLCPPIFAAPYLPAAVLAIQASGDWRASCCVATRIGCKRRTARAARRYCFTSTTDRA